MERTSGGRAFECPVALTLQVTGVSNRSIHPYFFSRAYRQTWGLRDKVHERVFGNGLTQFLHFGPKGIDFYKKRDVSKLPATNMLDLWSQWWAAIKAWVKRSRTSRFPADRDGNINGSGENRAFYWTAKRRTKIFNIPINNLLSSKVCGFVCLIYGRNNNVD